MHFVAANLPTQRANSTFHKSIETSGAALAEFIQRLDCFQHTGVCTALHNRKVVISDILMGSS
jgi:hypothetical protein